jgi:hypothetical protein
MQSPMRIAIRPTNWRGKGLLRISLLVLTAIAIAGLASFFGVARDYGYLRATLLSGNPGGKYHALAASLAERAGRGHGHITVVATEGSVDSVNRLAKQKPCTATFAFVQDGIPAPRIDSAREKVEARFERLIGLGLTREQIQALPAEHVLREPGSRATARDIMAQLTELRGRCQRYTKSIVTPMGDEMFYRYQEALINDLIAALGILIQSSPRPTKQPAA